MRPHLLAQEAVITPRAIRRFLREGGDETIGILLLAYGDGIASNPYEADLKGLEPLIHLIHRVIAEAVEQRKTPFKRLIGGEDLKKVLGMDPGPRMGEILKRIEEEQLDGRIQNREEALALAKEWLNC